MRSMRYRTVLTFRAVNRPDCPGYDPGLQRHHLLPLELLGSRAFQRFIERIPGEVERFDDFRANGLLLPCNEVAALRMGLPLHRGPHRTYSALVRTRMGQIEAGWAQLMLVDPQRAASEASMRLELLRRALRRYILATRGRMPLNRRDPFVVATSFDELDAMADALWSATEPAA